MKVLEVNCRGRSFEVNQSAIDVSARNELVKSLCCAPIQVFIIFLDELAQEKDI